MKKPISSLIIFLAYVQLALSQTNTTPSTNQDWKAVLQQNLHLMGHRNWILVVDKAFPAQTSNGIEVIYTNEDYFTVLQYVKNQIDSSTNVKAQFYVDKELNYLTPKLVPQIDAFKKNLFQLLGNNYQTLAHEEVFAKMKTASKTFNVLVLKTQLTMPYTSVFLQLDCKYWSAEKEKELRERMKLEKNSQ